MPSTTQILQAKVNESLNNALENGYSFDSWTVQEIASDLIAHDAEFEENQIDELVPLILVWKESQ